MITRETYTKIFLEEWGKSTDPATLQLYKHEWWFNTRTKNSGGLRLTDKGYEFLTGTLELRSYEIPFTETIELSPQVIIFFDKFLDCPYWLCANCVIVFSEKKSFELYLFSDDIRKYGLIKAINNQNKNEEV